MSATPLNRCRLGLLAALLAAALALAVTACGDGEDFFFDVPTATPFFTRAPLATPVRTATPIRTATPSDLSPTPTEIAEEATPTPRPATGTANVTPVTAFEITAREAVNVRAAPNTDAEILDVISPGDTRTVVGEARGEEALAGQGTLWYSLESGGFVYAPLVEKAEAEE